MDERTSEEVVERLEWWLAYFNDETDKYLSPHPDFIKNIEGFDETAIEADLRAAARRLREIPDGERIGVYMNEVPEHSRNCSCADARTWEVNADCGHYVQPYRSGTLFLNPQEPDNEV